MEKKLKKLLADSDNELEKYVIEDLLAQDEPEVYINDLLFHGCVSGLVSGLIYYSDTKEFFNKFENEIEELKEEIEDSLGEPLQIKSPVSNWLAWFGYEEMTRKVAYKLGLEI